MPEPSFISDICLAQLRKYAVSGVLVQAGSESAKVKDQPRLINLEHGCIKDKIKMSNRSLEPPASSKIQNKDLKGKDGLYLKNQD